jgi:hypothetical protein
MSAEQRKERFEQLAADAALFGLDADELRELVDLRDSPELGELAADLADLELLAGEIAAESFIADASEQALPESLRLALGEAARGEAPRRERERASLREISGGRGDADVDRPGSTRALPWLLAAAAIVVAVVGWSRQAPEQPVAAPAPTAPTATADAASPALATVDTPTPSSERERLLGLAGTTRTEWSKTKDEAAQAASGDVVWHSGLQRGFMRFKGLAHNDPTHTQYQLWIFDAERDERYPVDGGVFDVGPDGEVIVPISAKLDVRKAKLFAITVEKPGGVVVSKRERIVLTAAPAS